MSKSILPTFKKWTIDEKRLLVLFLLLVIYPIFVLSFFALFAFVIIPLMLMPHVRLFYIYWLAVTGLWMLLCCLILPCFQKKKITVESSKTYPPIKVEGVKDSESISSKRSLNSKDDSKDLKKTNDSESDKESLKLREDLGKSYDSLNKISLTKSGEFLNDFVSRVEYEEVKTETVCEVHVEASKDSANKAQTRDLEREIGDSSSKRKSKNYEGETAVDESERKIINTKEHPGKNIDEKRHSDNALLDSESSRDDCEGDASPRKAKTEQATPLQTDDYQEGTVDSEVMEEVVEMEDKVSVHRRVKAIPAVDTTRASGYYECSMPTPKAFERQNSINNTVFLYVTPETPDTEQSFEVSQKKNSDSEP